MESHSHATITAHTVKAAVTHQGLVPKQPHPKSVRRCTPNIMLGLPACCCANVSSPALLVMATTSPDEKPDTLVSKLSGPHTDGQCQSDSCRPAMAGIKDNHALQKMPLRLACKMHSRSNAILPNSLAWLPMSAYQQDYNPINVHKAAKDHTKHVTKCYMSASPTIVWGR